MFCSTNAARKTLRIASSTLLAIGAIAAVAIAICRSSSPVKSGKKMMPGLISTVRVDRDARSIPAVESTSRADLSRVLGFLHAQERYFQMDALRRLSAGELSELFGSATLSLDERLRPFCLREVARKIVSELPPKERGWLDAYTEGVNEGLRNLLSSPFEYWLLRSKPKPWRPEDSFLVCYNLFSALQDFRGELTRQRETLCAHLPPQVAKFFTENGSIWQAKIDGSRDEILPIPEKEHFAYLLSAQNRSHQPSAKRVEEAHPRISDPIGSNCWALTSDLTGGNGAMIACDMHLHIGVPNIWYRASLSYIDEAGQRVRLHGATIPGVPALIMGSNERIAWGFTNAQLNTTDLMRVERIGDDHYMGPEGPLPLKTRREVISVRGAPDFVQEQKHTKWGPLAPSDDKGHFNAMHWVGQSAQALDLSLMGLERAKSVQEGVQIATSMRTPVLNFFVADDKGQIGWSLSGSMPKRERSARRVIDSKKGGWETLMAPEQMPSKIYSSEGRLWNANHSMLSPQRWGCLGTENMLNGIRGHQIRSSLFSRSEHSFDQMHRLQLEVRAPFFERWQRLLQELLTASIETKMPGAQAAMQSQKTSDEDSVLSKRRALLAACQQWDGQCRANSRGYPIIRRFREQVTAKLLSRFLAPCFGADPTFTPQCVDSEEPIFKLISERPPHLADPLAGSWEDELLQAADDTAAYFAKKYPRRPLDCLTWNDEQNFKIEHPLSKAIGWLSSIINLPSSGMGGDKWVPKVLYCTLGATQRMVLYPGNETLSSFEMPGGQSGNPLSSHYRDLHPSWMKGDPTPLLPTKAVHTLHFLPPSSRANR